MKLQGQYDEQYFKASKSFQVNTERIKVFADFIQGLKPTNVLDVGCGMGTLACELRKRGIKIFGVDSAEILSKKYWNNKPYCFLEDAKKLPFDDSSFDVVFSSDFFEHISEDDLDLVFSEMQRVGRRVFASIAFEDNLNKRQQLYHLINKPKDWWIQRLPNLKIIN